MLTTERPYTYRKIGNEFVLSGGGLESTPYATEKEAMEGVWKLNAEKGAKLAAADLLRPKLTPRAFTKSLAPAKVVTDLASLKAAINDVTDGGEVRVAKGVTIRTDATIAVAKNINVTFEERQNGKLVAPDGQFFFVVKDNKAPNFMGLKFDGSGVEYEGTAGGIVDYCRFDNFQRGKNVGFGSGTALGQHNNAFDPHDWHVTNCTFTGNGGGDFGGWAIGFWRGNGVWITDNEFINVGNGIKTNNGGATANEIHVERNYMLGIRRMNAEMQGQVTNFTLIDNYVEGTRLSGSYNENINCLGWSVIYHGDKTRNVVIRRNIQIEKNRGDGTGVRIIFETGNNAVVEDNYADGIGTFAPVFMGDTSGSRSEESIGRTDVKNNRLVDVKSAGYAYGQWAKNAYFSNNSATTTLSQVMQSRLARGYKPGPGKSEGTGTPTPTPTPTTTFAINGKPVDSADYLTKGSAVEVTWADAPAGTAKIVFEPRATNATTIVSPTAGLNADVLTVERSGKATIKGARWAWLLDYRGVAYDATGKKLAESAWSNVARVQGVEGSTEPGGSGAPWPPKPIDPPPPPPSEPIEQEAELALPLTVLGVAVSAKVAVLVKTKTGDCLSVRMK